MTRRRHSETARAAANPASQKRGVLQEGRWRQMRERVGTSEARLEEIAVTLARVILGVVCLWFGWNELIQPHLWTGYVPLIASSGTLAVILVLLHGGTLFVLGIALVCGIAPRVAALIVGMLVIEIILDLTIGHPVNDIAVRDLGILGLSLALAGSRRQRLLLTN